MIQLYFFDNQKHHTPHIHAEYSGEEGIFSIESGEMIEGSLPKKQKKLVEAWIEIHREELMADWKLAINGEPIFRIEPLK